METEKLNGNRLFPALWSDFFDKEPFFAPRRFTGETPELLPAVNVRENKKAFVVELALPGFQKEDFAIDTDDNRLTIRAEKEEETVDEDDRYTRREFSCRSFSRSFTLPENTNAEAIDAAYSKGILKLNIPKKAETKTAPKKTIKVV